MVTQREQKNIKWWHWVVISLVVPLVSGGVIIGRYESKVEVLEKQVNEFLIIKEEVSICKSDILVLKTLYVEQKESENKAKENILNSLARQEERLDKLLFHVRSLN